ncbi:hypothetical protein D3C73_1625530 [compost metagenome]
MHGRDVNLPRRYPFDQGGDEEGLLPILFILSGGHRLAVGSGDGDDRIGAIDEDGSIAFVGKIAQAFPGNKAV